jgi:hypothetical protein
MGHRRKVSYSSGKQSQSSILYLTIEIHISIIYFISNNRNTYKIGGMVEKVKCKIDLT